MSTLSICIPTYEPRLDYLEQLLRSISNTDHRLTTQILISDDNSSNYEAIEALVATVVPHATVSRSGQRLGMVGNWNRALADASGEYLIVPGQDDLLDIGAISMLIDRARTTGVDVAFGAEQYVSADGASRLDPRRGPTVDRIWTSTERHRGVLVDARICLLFVGVLGDPCAAVIRAATLRQVGGFSPSYGHSADTEFWMRVSARGGKVLLTDLPTSKRRIHDDNATASHVRSGVASADRAALLHEYGAAMPASLRRQAAARLYLHRAWDVVRTPALLKPDRGRSGAPTSAGALLAAVAVDLRLGIALRASRRKFEAAALG